MRKIEQISQNEVSIPLGVMQITWFPFVTIVGENTIFLIQVIGPFKFCKAGLQDQNSQSAHIRSWFAKSSETCTIVNTKKFWQHFIRVIAITTSAVDLVNNQIFYSKFFTGQ